jgi:hypothetical protein
MSGVDPDEAGRRNTAIMNAMAAEAIAWRTEFLAWIEERRQHHDEDQDSQARTVRDLRAPVPEVSALCAVPAGADAVGAALCEVDVRPPLWSRGLADEPDKPVSVARPTPLAYEGSTKMATTTFGFKSYLDANEALCAAIVASRANGTEVSVMTYRGSEYVFTVSEPEPTPSVDADDEEDEEESPEDRAWASYCAAAKGLDREALYDELMDELRDGGAGDPFLELIEELTSDPEYDASRPSYHSAVVLSIGKLAYRLGTQLIDRKTREALSRTSEVRF